MTSEKLHPNVGIGHVHLRVADLERATAFYHHIGSNTWTSAEGAPASEGYTGLYHLAIVHPDRGELGRAVRRVLDPAHPIDGAEDHGATVSVYLRDPDGNGVELHYDRPRKEWFDPRGRPVLKAAPLDPRDPIPVHDW